jgi:nucleoside-diphosphate-sugar epimerase
MATLLIVGASGKMGTALITAALAAGHRVNALVRSRAKAAHLPAGVTIFEGDGRDVGASQRRSRAPMRSLSLPAAARSPWRRRSSARRCRPWASSASSG